jgi:hypothetical protein
VVVIIYRRGRRRQQQQRKVDKLGSLGSDDICKMEFRSRGDNLFALFLR